MAKFCPNCGSNVREGAAFCANCGTKLNVTPVAETAPVAAPVEAAPVAAPVEPAPVVEAAPVAPVAEPVPVAPVVEPAPVAEPVVEAAPVAPVVEPAPVAEPVVEPAPVAAPVEAAPVAEPVPVAAPVEAAPVAPVAEPVPVAAPVAAAVAPAPVAAPVEAAPAAAAPAPMAVSSEPMPFEAPSGPVVAAPVETTETKNAPKKLGKGAIIGILAGVGVVVIALIAVGVIAILNGGFGFGGTFIDRTEKMDVVDGSIKKDKYAVYDEDFNDYIVEARWWDYDSTMEKPGCYNVDTETLAFSIEVNEDAEDEIYYAYYYSKDKEFDKEDLSKPLLSDNISPVEYSDGKAFYNVECDKKIQKGYYVVVIAANEKSINKPYIVAYAEVK